MVYCTTTVASLPIAPGVLVVKFRFKRPLVRATPRGSAAGGVAVNAEVKSTVQPLLLLLLAVTEPEPVPALGAQGAVQLALVPPPMPEHVQLYWPCDELTEPAVPAVQRLLLGKMDDAVLAAVPQEPLTVETTQLTETPVTFVVAVPLPLVTVQVWPVGCVATVTA